MSEEKGPLPSDVRSLASDNIQARPKRQSPLCLLTQLCSLSEKRLCLREAGHSPALEPAGDVVSSLGTTGACTLSLSGRSKPLTLSWSPPAFGQTAEAQFIAGWLLIDEA